MCLFVWYIILITCTKAYTWASSPMAWTVALWALLAQVVDLFGPWLWQMGFGWATSICPWLHLEEELPAKARVAMVVVKGVACVAGKWGRLQKICKLAPHPQDPQETSSVTPTWTVEQERKSQTAGVHGARQAQCRHLGWIHQVGGLFFFLSGGSFTFHVGWSCYEVLF